MAAKTDPSSWYRSKIGERLSPSMASVFAEWSDLKDGELEAHLYRVRERAWEQIQYPCLGLWLFLLPSISLNHNFPMVVQLATAPGATVVDLGTGLGQDLRLLAAHGVKTETMYAVDKDAVLWKLGYELFLDTDRMHATFIAADFVAGAHAEADSLELPSDEEHQADESLLAGHKSPRTGISLEITLPPGLQLIKGRASVIIAAQFLHLFSLRLQIVACARVVALSHVGTVIIGYQMGRQRAAFFERPWGLMFYHNVETWTKMWETVGRMTNTQWDVECAMVELSEWGMIDEDLDWVAADQMGLNFVCRRVD